MRRNLFPMTVLLALLCLIVGCDSSSSDTPAQETIVPSTTDYTFGVQSMVVPYGDYTTTLEFVYDDLH